MGILTLLYLLSIVITYWTVSKNWDEKPWTLRRKINTIFVSLIPIVNFITALFCIIFFAIRFIDRFFNKIDWEKEQKW